MFTNSPGNNGNNPMLGGSSHGIQTWKSAPVQTATAPVASSSSTPVEPTAAELQLKQLTSLLQKDPAQLSPEVQQMMQTLHINTSQADTKHMHAAVTRLGNAKSNLAHTQAARAHLHMCWRAFMTDAVSRWEKYVAEFSEQDTQMETQLGKNVAELKEARRALEEVKDKAIAKEEVPTDGGDISDEELTEEKKDSAVALRTDMATIVHSLQGLKQKAEECAEQEAQRKKARTDMVGAIATSKAAQPFA